MPLKMKDLPWLKRLFLKERELCCRGKKMLKVGLETMKKKVLLVY